MMPTQRSTSPVVSRRRSLSVLVLFTFFFFALNADSPFFLQPQLRKTALRSLAKELRLSLIESPSADLVWEWVGSREKTGSKEKRFVVFLSSITLGRSADLVSHNLSRTVLARKTGAELEFGSFISHPSLHPFRPTDCPPSLQISSR